MIRIKKLLLSACLTMLAFEAAASLNIEGSLRSYLPTLAKNLNSPDLAHIDELDLKLKVNPDSGCEIVSSYTKARTLNLNGELTCVFTWETIPAGISGGLLSASGVPTDVGEETLSYSIAFFSGRNSEKVVINSEDITFDLAMPQQPVITRVSSSWEEHQNEGLTTFNYSQSNKLTRIDIEVEARPFDQVVEISKLGSCIVAANSTHCSIELNGNKYGSDLQTSGYSMHYIHANSKNKFFSDENKEVFTIAWDYRKPEIIHFESRYHTDFADERFGETFFSIGPVSEQVINKQAKVVIKSPYPDETAASNMLLYSADLTKDIWVKEGSAKPTVWNTSVKAPSGFADAKSFRYEQGGMNGQETSSLTQCVDVSSAAGIENINFTVDFRASMGTLGDQVGIKISEGCTTKTSESETKWLTLSEQWQNISVSKQIDTTVTSEVTVHIFGNNGVDEKNIFFIANPQLYKGEEKSAYVPTLRTARTIAQEHGEWRIPDSVKVDFFADSDYENPDRGLTLDSFRVLYEGSRKEKGKPFSIQSTASPKVVENYYIYTLDLSIANDGVFIPTVYAQDNKGNASKEQFEQIKIDRSKPEIQFYQVNRQLKDGDGVYFIDDIIINADDRYIGGAKVTEVTINDAQVEIDDSNENFARIIDQNINLKIGELYKLGVKAVDAEGNVSLSELNFEYMPVIYEEKHTADEVFQHVQLHTLQLIQRKGRRCKYFLNKEDAVKNTNYANYACFVEFSSEGQHTLSEQATIPTFSGIFTKLGQNKVTYRMMLTNPRGTISEMTSGEVLVSVIEPNEPEITTRPEPELGIYPISLDGGMVTTAILSASNGDITMEISGEKTKDTSYSAKQSTINKVIRLGRRIYANEGNLWSESEINVKGFYDRSPHISTEKKLKTVYVPSRYIRATLNSSFKESLNIDKQYEVIKIGIYDRKTREYVYDKSTMGTWKGYIAFRQPDGTLIPITPEQEIENSEAEFEIDISEFQLGSSSYVGVAHLESPVPGYKRHIVTNRNFVRVWKGTEVDGGIRASRVFGKVPFMFYGRYQTDTLDDKKALGKVEWEITQDDVNWEVIPAGKQDTFLKKQFNEAGVYKIRAKAYNKFTGVESITDSIEVTAFNTPNVSIVGPSTMYFGETQDFKLMDRGELADEVTGIIEWSFDKENWFEGGNTFSHTASKDTTGFQIHARMRYEDTDAAGQYAYDIFTKIVSVRPPSQPLIQINGSINAEVGREYKLTASVRSRYSGIFSEVDGRWILPDGTEINDSTFSITVPPEWKGESIPLIYQAWHVGLEDETLSEKTFFAKGWEYTFPDYDFKITQRTKFAPSQISVYANRQRESYPEPISFDVKFQPLSDMEMEYESTIMARFLAKKTGVHVIRAIVTDSRGNEREFIQTIDVIKADPPEVRLRGIYSNRFKREPLDVTLYADVRPSHYQDRVTEYNWFANGQPVTGFNNKGIFSDLYEGENELKLIAKTLHGHEVEIIEKVNVQNNLKPVCNPTYRVERFYVSMKSNCTDSDGKLVYYDWIVDGNTTSAHGSSINYYFPGAKNPGKISVRMIAFDDSTESTEVTLDIDTK